MEDYKGSSFVYYLMSNASMNVYPDNKPQNFRTLLPRPLILDGEWEVGISTVIYPHNWNQLKSDSYVEVHFPLKYKSVENIENYKLKVDFTYRQFTSIDEAVNLLNETINNAIEKHIAKDEGVFEKTRRNGQFTYKHLELSLSKTLPRKIHLLNYGYAPGLLKILLPSKVEKERELWRLFGFEDSITMLVEGTEAKHPASLHLHFPSLYVYSPIIEYVGVGDTHAPLFAIVPIRGNLGEVIYERFEKPIYVRLTQKFISEIAISIKDDTGEDIQFGAGKTILILHFRRRS